VSRPPVRQLAAALACLVLLAAACQTDAEPIRDEDLVDQAREVLDEIRGDDPDPGAAPGDADPPPPDPDPGDAQPPDAVEQPAAAVDDRDGLGAMCRAYLRPDVPRLVIEVAHQAGAMPTGAALDHMTGTLEGVLDKPGGITVRAVEIPSGPQTWSENDVRVLAERHRVERSSSEQAVMQVVALRGQFEDRETLGVAFDASTFAGFPDRIDGLATLLGGRDAIERAVLVHEAGHLLCLVNITYRSAIDHEDPERPHHSRDPESVMYWAVANSAVAQVFSGPPPADFTANDRADLEGLRTGRY
jgi:hypothetical protein